MEAAKSQIEHIAYHKGPLAILIFIVGLFILVVASLSTAATRGIRVKAKSLTGIVREIPLYSDYYALVIGCSAYRAGWPPLPNAVKDAREVANTLKRMGWKIHLLENPDSFTLRKALNSLVVKAGRKKDRAIFLWYSGHGHTIREADGTLLGYIIPVDAPLPHKDLMGFVEKAVNMRQIETVSKGILSRHVLMVFDSCFSGAIFALNRAAPSPYIEEKIARPVREYITAGGEDETVPDRSVFKTCFLQGIEDGYADLNRDGFVTGEELGAYLQEKVVNYTRKAQHPQFGKINNPKLDKGDFVILSTKNNPIGKLSEPHNLHYPQSPVVLFLPISKGGKYKIAYLGPFRAGEVTLQCDKEECDIKNKIKKAILWGEKGGYIPVKVMGYMSQDGWDGDQKISKKRGIVVYEQMILYRPNYRNLKVDIIDGGPTRMFGAERENRCVLIFYEKNDESD